MSDRTLEDRLRSEYFELLPHIRWVADELETEVRYLLIPVMRSLQSHEKVVVKSRVKIAKAPSKPCVGDRNTPGSAIRRGSGPAFAY